MEKKVIIVSIMWNFDSSGALNFGIQRFDSYCKNIVLISALLKINLRNFLVSVGDSLCPKDPIEILRPAGSRDFVIITNRMCWL